MPLQQLVGRRARVRRPAGQQLEQHAAKTVHVAAAVQRFAANLLRRHVAPRAFDRLLDAQETQQTAFGPLGDAEVDQFHVAVVVDQEIVRLDVAVNPALLVQVVQAMSWLG